jgi:DNA repair protein RecO (recombination protein O)
MQDSMRDRIFKTEAIVLSRLDYAEADRILVVFTPYRGKLDVIAKGARKALSRLGPHLDFFARVNLNLTRGRDLDVVTGVETLDPYVRLRQNLDAYGHACYFVELIKGLTQPRQEHREVYDLLSRSLVLLDDGVEPWVIARHFELALLHALGYRPELFHCVNCKEVIAAERNSFSSEHGGLLCPRCRNEDPASIPLSVNAQKYLRTLERSGLAAAARFTPSPMERLEIQQVTSHYVRHIAEHDFHSLKVLGALQQATLEPGRR